MTKSKSLKNKFFQIGLILLLLISVVFVSKLLFDSPRKTGPKVLYRIPQTAINDAITGDLEYYGFVKDRNALEFALWVKGGIMGKDIKRGVTYEISQTMNVWQIADILLNKVYVGQNYDCDRGCPDSNFTPELLPGGDPAPTITQKYEWVENYDDCVEAIGHDGGQLSSEQYAERTGIRKCVSPDGREFTQGKEGWTTAVGG